MSFLDKIASTIMPPESEEDRANARRTAQALAGDGEWLAIVLEHHRQIEAGFSRALTAGDAAGRMAACKELAILLTGHANAEESVLYPALADIGEKGRAGTAYEEQAMAKIEMARLETLDPMSSEWSEKLEHIKGAIRHHMYEEEGTWFPELQQNVPASRHGQLTRRFLEEFDRYAGSQAHQAPRQMAAQMQQERR
jgi:hypothetical protein